jgi:Plasmid pRiA4b ORF-3-like protein
VARTWLSIRVELVSGHGEDVWPRPGRIFAAARSHTFRDLARAIDDAFARWDHSHLHLFTLADQTHISPLRWWGGEEPEGTLDGDKTTLGRLKADEQFAYVFDLGDDWAHMCTVGQQRIDPLEQLGIHPEKPMAYWGWGDIPDQYRRRFDGDDGETPVPRSPGLKDLPPILPWWGKNRR